MDSSPSVSVIVVTYHSREHISHCLNRLSECAGESVLERIVVDNASGDGVGEQIARECGDVRFLQNSENVGFGRAVNQGARIAKGEYLLILNPDAFVRPGAVRELVRFMEHRPAAGACGPRILDLEGRFQHYSRRGFPTPLNALAYLSGLDRLFPHSRLLGGYYRRYLSPMLEVVTDSLAGCCMMVRRSEFETVGGFDEDYFLFGEDIDLCWKIKEAGHEIWYVPSSVVEHRKGASMRHARGRAHFEFYRAMKLFIDKRLAARYPAPALTAVKMGVSLAAMMERRFR